MFAIPEGLPAGYPGLYHKAKVGQEVDAVAAIGMLEPGEATSVTRRYGPGVKPDDLLWTYIEIPISPFAPYVDVARPQVANPPHSLVVADHRLKVGKGGPYPPLVFGVDRKALLAGHHRMVGWWDGGLGLVPVLLVALRSGKAT